MHRRNFLGGAILLGAAAAGGCKTPYDARKISGQSESSITTGALRTIRDKYRSDLLDKFIPNMDRYVIDHQYGGFMCSVNIETGEQVGSGKTAWFEGRGLWTYSFFYNNIKKDPAILEVARKSKDFIMRAEPADDSFWTSGYTREGKATSGPGDIYSSLFVAEGLAEYAKASGEAQYFDKAKLIVKSCMKRYDSPDYDYFVAYLTPQSPKVPAPRVLGHWMVFLRALTQLLEREADPELERMADRCIDAIVNKHVHPGYGLFNEQLNHDFSRPDNEFKDFCYTGHGIETCWMLMYEAARRKDKQLYEKTTELFRKHVDLARDRVYGGYFRSLDHVDNNTWKVDKVLWLQEEILIGSLFMIQQNNDPWAVRCFLDTFDYVNSKFDRPGYKFWVPGGDRLVKQNQMTRAENYHHPRHLMLNMLALDQLIANEGRSKSVFNS